MKVISQYSKGGKCGHTQYEIHTIESYLSEMSGEGSNSFFNASYLFIWIQQGRGGISIDLTNHKIEGDTIYYIKPGQVIILEMHGQAKGFIISFPREFAEFYEEKTSQFVNTTLFNHFLTTPVIKINTDINAFLLSVADEMLLEFKNSFDLRLEILKGLFKIFILYLSRQCDADYQIEGYSRKMQLSNFFFMHLEKNFATKKQVRDYAELLSITPNYLNNTIKEISGFTASYHIQQRIVLEAKRKAFFEGYSLKETAYYLGFWDPSHFSKYFKNSSGINFTDFKKGITDFC